MQLIFTADITSRVENDATENSSFSVIVLVQPQVMNSLFRTFYAGNNLESEKRNRQHGR